MKNHKFAIAIPTYNRSNILKSNLDVIISECFKYNIPIYISDDSNNNDTLNMVRILQQKYEYIYYTHNPISLGHDQNCINTLKLPSEEYVWYIGDSLSISRGSIDILMKFLDDADYDFIITNHKGRNRTILEKSKEYTSNMTFYKDLAWHITLSGSTIYNKNVLSNISKYQEYINFPQVAIVLDTLLSKCKIYYCSDVSTIAHPDKVSYWGQKVFQTFCVDWFNLINLIDCSERDKITILRSHSINTKMFSIKQMLTYRSSNSFDFKLLYANYSYLKYTTSTNGFVLFLISLFPIKILQLIPLFNKKK